MGEANLAKEEFVWEFLAKWVQYVKSSTFQKARESMECSRNRNNWEGKTE